MELEFVPLFGCVVVCTTRNNTGRSPNDWDTRETIRSKGGLASQPVTLDRLAARESSSRTMCYEAEFKTAKQLERFTDRLDGLKVSISNIPVDVSVETRSYGKTFRELKSAIASVSAAEFSSWAPGERPDTVVLRGVPRYWVLPPPATEQKRASSEEDDDDVEILPDFEPIGKTSSGAPSKRDSIEVKKDTGNVVVEKKDDFANDEDLPGLDPLDLLRPGVGAPNATLSELMRRFGGVRIWDCIPTASKAASTTSVSLATTTAASDCDVYIQFKSRDALVKCLEFCCGKALRRKGADFICRCSIDVDAGRVLSASNIRRRVAKRKARIEARRREAREEKRRKEAEAAEKLRLEEERRLAEEAAKKAEEERVEREKREAEERERQRKAEFERLLREAAAADEAARRRLEEEKAERERLRAERAKQASRAYSLSPSPDNGDASTDSEVAPVPSHSSAYMQRAPPSHMSKVSPALPAIFDLHHHSRKRGRREDDFDRDDGGGADHRKRRRHSRSSSVRSRDDGNGDGDGNNFDQRRRPRDVTRDDDRQRRSRSRRDRSRSRRDRSRSRRDTSHSRRDNSHPRRGGSRSPIEARGDRRKNYSRSRERDFDRHERSSSRKREGYGRRPSHSRQHSASRDRRDVSERRRRSPAGRGQRSLSRPSSRSRSKQRDRSGRFRREESGGSDAPAQSDSREKEAAEKEAAEKEVVEKEARERRLEELRRKALAAVNPAKARELELREKALAAVKNAQRWVPTTTSDSEDDT